MTSHISPAQRTLQATEPAREIVSFRIADFSSWVREQLHPGPPDVAVYSGDRIVCCSSSLRRRGLKPGELMKRVRLLFPDATLYSHDPHLDAATWEDVLHLLHTIAPNLVSPGIGWALMTPCDPPALQQLARLLRGSVGVARSRMVAILAALDAPPGEVRRIESASGTSFLERSPVRHLEALGFASELVERLELSGLITLGDLASLTRRHLHEEFGNDGIRLFDMIHLESSDGDIPTFRPPPSISAAYDFMQPAEQPEELLPALEQMIDHLLAELGEQQAQLLSIRITGRWEPGFRRIRRVLKAPTADTEYLRIVCQQLLERMMRPGEPVKSIAIELGGLVECESAGGAQVQHPAIYQAVKTIHREFPGRSLRAIIADDNVLRRSL